MKTVSLRASIEKNSCTHKKTTKQINTKKPLPFQFEKKVKSAHRPISFASLILKGTKSIVHISMFLF